jgi:hypothetical protein
MFVKQKKVDPTASVLVCQVVFVFLFLKMVTVFFLKHLIDMLHLQGQNKMGNKVLLVS